MPLHMCPLPTEVWMKIFTEVAVQQRLDWWAKLTDIEREYKEWPLCDEEVAEHLYERVFDKGKCMVYS